MNNFRIGIIGGGQLGKMMILAAKRMGYYVVTLDPTKNCPSDSISDEHIIADFDDAEALKKLASLCDVVTYEFEHIDAKTLSVLEESGTRVYPTAKSLKIIQDKLTQKEVLKNAGVPVPDFFAAESLADVYEIIEKEGLPLILKTTRGGYDGKGNFCLRTKTDAERGFRELGGDKNKLMLEKFIDFDLEISVLACRATDGDIKIYPVAENIHVDNILRRTLVPANISAAATKKAMSVAMKVMEIFEGVGMFCVEMFCVGDDIYVNEVAPRPHNSGHYTIEGCVTSQFEQHIRAIANLPLGEPSLVKPSVMLNILGEEKFDGKAYVTGAKDVLKIKGASLHIYGKEITKPKRKMGHITITSDDLREAVKLADEAENYVKVITT